MQKHKSVNCIIISTDNGLAHVQCQTISWTNSGYHQLDPSMKYWWEYKFSYHGKSSKNSISKVAAILFSLPLTLNVYQPSYPHLTWSF